ncbi:MAG TPA: DUF5615 family PIN-like protein [Candidatus Binataceae bacterium]|nr:DUF5615 family PIN-like protein [Candidatus Binataceae bacterium]
MRFIADEGRDFAVVRALRDAAHDVIAAAEIFPSVDDEVILKLAHDDARILLTEDKDFGELVYAAGQKNCGVILIRFPASARRPMAEAVLEAVNRLGAALASQFAVIEPGRIRIGRGPRA